MGTRWEDGLYVLSLSYTWLALASSDRRYGNLCFEVRGFWEECKPCFSSHGAWADSLNKFVDIR